MAFTLATAVTEVRNLINESSGEYWGDSELESWINRDVLIGVKKLFY